MPVRYVSGLSRFAFALLGAGVLLKLLVLAMPAASAAPVGAEGQVTIIGQAVRAVSNAATLGLTGVALALPLAMLLGVPMGLRPRGRMGRALRAPVTALGGVPPFLLILLFLGLLAVRAKLIPTEWAVYAALGLGILPWLTIAIRDGLAGARNPEGELGWGRAIAGVLGRCLSQTGNVAMAVLIPGLFLVPGNGVLSLLESAVRNQNFLIAYAVLAVGLPAVLIAHLAGDLLLARWAPAQREPLPAPRTWLVAGLLMALVLALATLLPATAGPALTVDASLSVQEALPGVGHLLGLSSSGRDVLGLVGAGARVSLAVAFSAACLATLGGAMMAAVSRMTGELGTGLLMPRLPLPSVLTPLVVAICAVLISGQNPFMFTLALALAAIPAMARPVRTLLDAPDPAGRKAALLGLTGALVLVLTQSLLTEITLGTLNIGLPDAWPSLGALMRDGLRAVQAPHLIYPGVLTAVGIAGLSLLGHALVDVAGDPRGLADTPAAEPDPLA